MTFKHRFAALMALLLVLAGPAMAADPPWPALMKVGMAGTWAHSCSAAASPSNWFVTYAATGNGGARSMSNRGEDTRLTVVDSARLLSPTTVRLRLRYDDPKWGATNGFVYDVVIEVTARRSRALQSVRGDGTVMIKDGLFVSSGAPTPALEKCSN